MTIDKQKLKALAEAATPGRHYDRLESAGGGIKYECTGDDGSLVLKVDHKNNEFGFVGDRGEADEAFFLACSPATILALLAEIDDQALQTRSAREVCLESQATILSLIAERDQLKAESEALRKDAERYRWIERQPHAWFALGEAFDLPSEHEGAPGLASSIDAAMVKETQG